MFGPGVHVTFLAAEVPRASSLALWPAPLATTRIELALPDETGSGVEVRTVPARLVPVSDVLDELAALPADAPATRSAHAWADVARVALGLVARGRLQRNLEIGGQSPANRGAD